MSQFASPFVCFQLMSLEVLDPNFAFVYVLETLQLSKRKNVQI